MCSGAAKQLFEMFKNGMKDGYDYANYAFRVSIKTSVKSLLARRVERKNDCHNLGMRFGN